MSDVLIDPASSPESQPAGQTCQDPVFILTASRSGSTLLRFILDTHPQFACPPETMITAACVALLRSWDLIENAGSGQQRLVTDSAQLPTQALATVRNTVDMIYGRYLARRGKPRWCDKSLDSLYSAAMLAQLYPGARFVCLYRHCMDVIASGVEVCPWGVSRFGFDPYVAQHPGNSVAAIGSYWADCAGTMLAFEEAEPARCYRVRYEDLVTAPEEVTAGLLAFLGAEPTPGITSACFSTPHEGDGPGDEKIWFTTGISDDAIGRGVMVPGAALPPPMREQVNGLLRKLGYRPVEDDWNDHPGPVDPRLQAGNGTVAANGSSPGRRNGSNAASLAAGMLRAVEARIRSHAAAAPQIPVRWPALAGQTVALVVADGGEHAELRWTLPGSASPAASGDGRDAADAVTTLIADPRVWQALLAGRANVISEIRSGRLRCINKRDAFRVRSDEVHAIAWLLGLAQVPLASQAACPAAIAE